MRRMLMFCLMVAVAPFGWAAPAEATPDQLLRAATLELAEGIRQDGQRRSGQLLLERVGSTVLPWFDAGHMTRLAMAQSWGLASPVQQQALVAEFRALLARTYVATLAYRPGQAIEFRPLRWVPDTLGATLRSSLKQSGIETASVDYVMEKTASGWKIHDLRIAGVSMVASYRSAFAELIRARGVEGLLQGLAAANQQAQASDRPDESAARNALFSYSILTSVVRGRH